MAILALLRYAATLKEEGLQQERAAIFHFLVKELEEKVVLGEEGREVTRGCISLKKFCENLVKCGLKAAGESVWEWLSGEIEVQDIFKFFKDCKKLGFH